MRIILILLFSQTLILGCKSKPFNQIVNKKKQGVWIDNYTQDSTTYQSYEYYKQGEPAKKWKSYVNGKIYKTEKYKNGICILKSYYENGKLESKGKTKLETNSVETHWFYFGEWKFYSDKGKLKAIKNYEKGELISEENIK